MIWVIFKSLDFVISSLFCPAPVLLELPVLRARHEGCFVWGACSGCNLVQLLSSTCFTRIACPACKARRLVSLRPTFRVEFGPGCWCGLNMYVWLNYYHNYHNAHHHKNHLSSSIDTRSRKNHTNTWLPPHNHQRLLLVMYDLHIPSLLQTPLPASGTSCATPYLQSTGHFCLASWESFLTPQCGRAQASAPYLPVGIFWRGNDRLFFFC